MDYSFKENMLFRINRLLTSREIELYLLTDLIYLSFLVAVSLLRNRSYSLSLAKQGDPTANPILFTSRNCRGSIDVRGNKSRHD